ncbi:unnamed protein product [Hermetia illucens]|uniref:Uncharacterized protein n=1 Tax=Hermetia illucens TaxID=343691 RepID=A0A7R8YXA7_HERIL|nr:unnamed protein product [Hermetia illucens]
MRVDFEFVLQLLVLVFQKETEFFNPSFRLRARKRRSRNPSDFHSAGAADCATQERQGGLGAFGGASGSGLLIVQQILGPLRWPENFSVKMFTYMKGTRNER